MGGVGVGPEAGVAAALLDFSSYNSSGFSMGGRGGLTWNGINDPLRLPTQLSCKWQPHESCLKLRASGTTPRYVS